MCKAYSLVRLEKKYIYIKHTPLFQLCIPTSDFYFSVNIRNDHLIVSAFFSFWFNENYFSFLVLLIVIVVVDFAVFIFFNVRARRKCAVSNMKIVVICYIRICIYFNDNRKLEHTFFSSRLYFGLLLFFRSLFSCSIN